MSCGKLLQTVIVVSYKQISWFAAH